MDYNKVISSLDKELGKGKVIRLGDTPETNHPVIPSGSIKLNNALNGGYPQGRMIEIFGENSSGKTTLAIHAIAEAQKMGLSCAFIDMEHAFNAEYAENLGVDVDNLLFSQPDYGEEALTIVQKFVESNIGLVVVDSIAALTPKAELEGEMGEAKMGLQARMMGQGMRKLVAITNKANTTVIWINQTRYKLGVMFGDPTTTPGGEAIKFATSQRLQVLASSKIKGKGGDGEIIGNKVIVKVIKNKIGSPHRKTNFDLIYGQGINSYAELIDLCVEADIIKKSGSWFSYGKTKLGQGSEGVKEILVDNPELTEELRNKLDSLIS